jgi:hypothetical protein
MRIKCVLSGFHCDVDEICALLGYYTVLSAGSSSVKKSKKKAFLGVDP